MSEKTEVKASVKRNRLIKKLKIFDLKSVDIVDVWSYNIDQEINRI